MLGAVRRRLATLWTDLSQVGERQPFHRAALVVVLLLDVFILVSIFEGLDAHTEQLTTPEDRVPPACAEIVIERGWNETSRLDRLAAAVEARAAHDEPVGRPARAVHPICAPLLDTVDAVRKDEELVRALRGRRRVQAEVRDLDAALSALRPSYDTALLQSMARAPAGPPIATIEMEVREKTGALEKARAHLGTIDAALDGAPPVATLWSRLARIRDDDRERLESDLRRMRFWFPVERLGMQLLFLLPLFAVFWAWSVRSARAGRGVQTLVASHLLVVSFVPILGKVLEAVHEIIPKRLLARLISLLAALNLVALWHYAVIAAAVGAALLVVWVAQRKLFSQEKLLEKRIAKGLCQSCGKRLPAGARACPFCGFGQFARCPVCGGFAHVCATHCGECGAPVGADPSSADLQPRETT